MKLFKKTNRQQSGAALVVGLLILLVMTLLGINGMQSAVLEEKISGNIIRSNIAFQAAESTLRVAEDLVENTLSAGDFPAVGTCSQITTPNDIDYFLCQHPVANCSSAAPPSNTLPNGTIRTAATIVAAIEAAGAGDNSVDLSSGYVTNSRYVIEKVCKITGGGGVGLGVGGVSLTGMDLYRITAIGYGPAGTAEVVLESLYASR